MKYGESTFDILYLMFAIVSGCIILKRSKGKTEKYMGIAALVLGCGDAFHLIPRVLNYFIDMDMTAPLGIGKLVTSITMTVFYVILYYVWLGYYDGKGSKTLTIVIWCLAAVRVILCLFPQNGWLSNSTDMTWGIIRNVPFVILGAIICFLYYKNRGKDKVFSPLWLYILLSFAFYIPVAVAAGIVPMLGMLMLPKTICYILMIVAFFRSQVTHDHSGDMKEIVMSEKSKNVIKLAAAFVAGVVVTAIIASAIIRVPAKTGDTDPEVRASGHDIDLKKVFPSWDPNSAALKQLVDFVADTTDASSPDYLEPADRIATFDMDGTILSEKAPVYIDWCLTMHRVLDDPTYNASTEERNAMQQVRDYAYSEGKTFNPEGLTKDDLVASAFEGMTPEEFRSYVVDFADNTDVVGFSGMTYGKSFYQPMLEVIAYLKANDFDVWMVSACEREVVRALVERYGIPYDHVVATDVPYVASGKGEEEPDEYNMGKDEKMLLGAPLDTVECGLSGKPAAIAREIGKRPVLAFGNSSGDYSMLNYAEGNPKHTGMGFFIICDDTVREYGSNEKAAGFYEEAEKQGWTPISMANDWLTIYGDGVEKTELPGTEEALPDAA